MSSSSTSSSPRPSRATQPSCAQLDASYSPARLASRNTSEDEDSDSSVSRLLRQEANDSDTDVNVDGDSGRGAEDDLETAPRRRRPRVREYIPRRRNHGELRELVEGVDYDLTDLHEPDLRVRDHPPPPELLYESFEDALAGVTMWAKDHGVSYNKQRWVRGGRCRLLMACYRRGKAKSHEAGDHEAGESSVRQQHAI